jgi:hypothetical protein|tara:strand:- start:1138 stop:1593 length:456 start_codon:yes stop_codon:yes gene_type:complete
MVTLTLPLEVFYTKNKKFILNLNNYRNAHYRVLSSAKKTYSDNLVEEIEKWNDIPRFDNPVDLEYVYYAKSNRRVDVSNPCSIIDKFTCDALVRVGILEDDSSKQIKSITYVYGGVDKDNPRCVLEIFPSLNRPKDALLKVHGEWWTPKNI